MPITSSACHVFTDSAVLIGTEKGKAFCVTGVLVLINKNVQAGS